MEKIANLFVESFICLFDQCGLSVIEDESDEESGEVKFHYYQTLIEANWSVIFTKDLQMKFMN